MKIHGFQLLLIAVISALLGYVVGVSKVNYSWSNYKPSVSIINREAPSSFGKTDFGLFWTVVGKLEDTYYDKSVIDPKKILNGAITGAVQSLGDPYTVYLPPTQNSEFKQGLAGQQFSGIGAELGMRGNQIIVVAPLDGHPAEKAGIKPGDAILKVDDKPTAGWTLAQVVDKIRGPKGTKVLLTIVHKNANEAKDISIERGEIKIKSVNGWFKKVSDIDQVEQTSVLKDNKDRSVAYIRISQFGDETNQEWVALVNKLYSQVSQDKNFAGVILDVRNNPGGYLSDATYIASEFIDGGVVVIQDKGNGDKTNYDTVRKGVLTTVPVIVLINKGSASASEIVAGALRDHNRAKLVGETSFGKGTIQQAEDLGQGAGLHITIAKWLTPNGTWVHGKGLTPDVSVSFDEKDTTHDTQLEKAIEELVK